MPIHGLNTQLHQLATTLVSSRGLEEVIKVVEKGTIYGENKIVEDLNLKMKTNINHSKEVEKVAKETKIHGGPVGVDLRVRS